MLKTLRTLIHIQGCGRQPGLSPGTYALAPCISLLLRMLSLVYLVLQEKIVQGSRATWLDLWVLPWSAIAWLAQDECTGCTVCPPFCSCPLSSNHCKSLRAHRLLAAVVGAGALVGSLTGKLQYSKYWQLGTAC